MYKRIVLKLSGAALAGARGFGLDAEKGAAITGELAEVHAMGGEVGVVVDSVSDVVDINAGDI